VSGRRQTDETDSLLRMNEELTLTGIVAESLPPALGTSDEPERYMVPALFTRRPNAKEVALIEDESTRQQLAAAGYDQVRLTVADHRLDIAGTNIKELKAGLATFIATMLHEASITLATKEATRVADLKALADREQRRSDLIAASAAQVSFQAAIPPHPQPPLLRAL
jgi:hypothetical protein